MNATGDARDVPMTRTIAEPLGPDDPRDIGPFTVIGVLGTGGMGEVYLGTNGESYVAVKRVRPRLVTADRFQREVGILYRVPAGVAPRVLATDGTVSRPWFAAEYVPGLTVDEAVRLHGPLPAEALWLLLAETATQLHAVHDAGIVHRDLKPANVMVVRDGVKLIDFGIARAVDQVRLTRSGGSYGTRGFTAPEQDAGDEDVASPADVYALGALMIYAASGRTPGVVPDIEAMRAVDADLAGIIESCLAADPDARPTAAALEELARMHVAPDATWPSVIADRIETRREFAATPVRKLETIPPPDEAEPEVETATVPPMSTAPDGERRRRSRKLIVLPIIAVVAVGAVVAYVLVPSVSSAGTTGVRANGSTSYNGVSVSKTTSLGTSSASAARSASATASAGTTTPATVPTDNTTPPRGSGTTTTSNNHTTASSTTTAAVVVTASSISAVDGNSDPEHVNGSEGDVGWIANNAACSAWLDSDGSGDLAGVLNTSQEQACGAELVRSDGVKFKFYQSTAAAKTNFISDQGYTMYICVWNQNSPSTTNCGSTFKMSGTTPVEVSN
ncbi:MAG TPA: serine/threonine-protein kinase [Actinospica sp.]|nr:serine/threonine-protein kinase [Actinospica sp.]